MQKTPTSDSKLGPLKLKQNQPAATYIPLWVTLGGLVILDVALLVLLLVR